MKTTESSCALRGARLLPLHLSGEVLAGDGSAAQLYRERAHALGRAPDLDKELRAYFRRVHGAEPPENKNLALVAIEEFRTLAKEAQTLRRCLRAASDPREQRQLLGDLAERQTRLDEYRQLGLSFEYACRVYLEHRLKFYQFRRDLYESKQLRRELSRPGIKSLDKDAKISEQDLSRLEHMLNRAERRTKQDSAAELRALACVYAEGSQEYKQLAAELGGKTHRKGGAKIQVSAEPAPTKSELLELARQAEGRAKDLWQESLVRYFWGQRQNETLLADIAAGKDVLENQEVVGYLNRLREWEISHPNTTVGGVLVGPPGVGKTTLVRHYLERTDRKYVYIDLSEDVTRYLLYGSKEIRFTNNSEYLIRLCRDIGGMDEAALGKFVAENVTHMRRTAGLAQDQALVLLLNQVDEELKKAEGGIDKATASQARERLSEFAQKAYRRELASEFAHLVHRNGWRDGVVIAALRRGDCPIFDEFPHFKQWHMLNSLMTAKPGERWYFADNDEWIEIPKNWRMYFTGNIGSRHGGFMTAEKMASRVAAEVMQIGYPSKRTELTTAVALLCDRDGNILRGEEDLAKLFVLVNDAFPKIRALTQKERHTVSISYRTLQTLAEKLVQRRDAESGALTYRARDTMSFDGALMQVMVDCYGLYEERKIPSQIVNILTSVGLLLDDAVKAEVLGFIDEKTYDERREQFGKMKADYNKVVAVLRGYADGQTLSADTLPVVF